MSHGSEKDNLFNTFYTEVKEIEKRDSVLTPKQQIDRLLRTGSTYRNLNPYEVLLVDYDMDQEQIRTKYKRLSLLVHPDKNQDDKDRAQAAFDAVAKAWKTLENPESRKKCNEIVEEAKERVLMDIAERKKKMRKEKVSTPIPEEESPLKMKETVKVLVMKLFAEYERKRRAQTERDQEERKRKREEELDQEEELKIQKEWMANFEKSRDQRSKSWQQFKQAASSSSSGSTQAEATTKPKKKIKTFKPPKHKAETR